MYQKSTFEYQSKSVGDSFRIHVGHPTDIHEPLSLAYVLDADFTFGTACDTAFLLSTDATRADGHKLLVIGIGCVNPDDLSPQRVRDFTPENCFPKSFLESMEKDLGRSFGSGYADNFIDFLVKELDPLVRDRFNVLDEPAALYGDSLGGLFTTYCFATHQERFNRYWIGSPAIVGKGRKLLDEFKIALDKVSSDSKLYLSIGEKERDMVPHKYFADAFDSLVLSLKESSRVPFMTDEFSGETHNSVGSIALARALSYLSLPSGD